MNDYYSLLIILFFNIFYVIWPLYFYHATKCYLHFITFFIASISFLFFSSWQHSFRIQLHTLDNLSIQLFCTTRRYIMLLSLPPLSFSTSLFSVSISISIYFLTFVSSVYISWCTQLQEHYNLSQSLPITLSSSVWARYSKRMDAVQVLTKQQGLISRQLFCLYLSLLTIPSPTLDHPILILGPLSVWDFYQFDSLKSMKLTTIILK